MQVESDLNNIKSAAVPVDVITDNTAYDTGLRQAAKQGNLQLAPKPVDSIGQGDDKRNNIRQAVGTTKVAGLASISRQN
jgi:hypothetical protein